MCLTVLQWASMNQLKLENYLHFPLQIIQKHFTMFSNILVSGLLTFLKKMTDPKLFGLCGLYLSLFTAVHIKTENF